MKRDGKIAQVGREDEEKKVKIRVRFRIRNKRLYIGEVIMGIGYGFI